MTEDDVLFGFRLRCLTLAEELGNVSAACRAMGIERSTYYRWKAKVDRFGLEALRVRERRRPRMPNQIGPHLEQGHVGGRVLPDGALAPGEPADEEAVHLHLLAGLRGVDGARWTAELVHRVAGELKAAGWKLGQVTSDNGSEFASRQFGEAVGAVGARQWRIKAGNPNSNGCVERAQLTVLEECWRPAFARSLAPKISALRRDLAEYLDEFNFDRSQTYGEQSFNWKLDAVVGSAQPTEDKAPGYTTSSKLYWDNSVLVLEQTITAADGTKVNDLVKYTMMDNGNTLKAIEMQTTNGGKGANSNTWVYARKAQ